MLVETVGFPWTSRLCPGCPCREFGAYDAPPDSSRSGRPPGRTPLAQPGRGSAGYAMRSPMLLGLLYVTMVMNALAFPIRSFISCHWCEYLGVGQGWLAYRAAVRSFLGQLAGAGVIACSRHLQATGRVFVGGSVMVLLMTMLFGLDLPWLSWLFCAVWPWGMRHRRDSSTAQSSITMLVTPTAMRGRMMGLLSVCIGAATPLGTPRDGVYWLPLLHRPACNCSQCPDGTPAPRTCRGADAAGLAARDPPQ